MYVNSFGEVLRWVSFTNLGGQAPSLHKHNVIVIQLQRDLVSKNGIPGPGPQIARDGAFAKNTMMMMMFSLSFPAYPIGLCYAATKTGHLQLLPALVV